MITKKTKIVCTIGPATESEEKLTALLNAGMNVMRLNFSHGDFKEHQARVDNLKKAMLKTGKTAAVLQDLGGPKIRIGMFKTESVMLKEGATFTLTTDKIEGDEKRVSVNYPLLPKEVKKGHIIFLHDGKKKLEVIDVKGNDVITKVLVGGDIKGKRGLNLPDSNLSISSLTEKDLADLEFGIKNKADFIALSFVRRPSDITELKDILKARKSSAKIIAKIETPQSLECIDEILDLTDGIMIARGDLAIEIPAEKVPPVTKMLIEKCNYLGKPIITATQMMESMIKSPVPTRAEVSDVANAIYDGTDAVMLSEETTLGDFPVQAVDMMSRIAETVEADDRYHANRNGSIHTGTAFDLIAESAVACAEGSDAELIIAIMDSYEEAQAIASVKPHCPVLVATTNPTIFNQVNLSYGLYPMLIKKTEGLKEAKAFAIKQKLVAKGDSIIALSDKECSIAIQTA
jgi:pyruvate kinase